MVTKEVYTADDIAKMLDIGRQKAYHILNEQLTADDPEFTVIKFGKLIRVPKEEFDRWLCKR